MNGGVFKKKKVYFSQVSNSALRDNTLSLKAKGLYALIQSYITIEGFTLYKNTLINACKESDTAFENAWNELKDAGYLKQDKFRNKAGHFVYEYELMDEKCPEIAKQTASHHTPKTDGVDNLWDGEAGVYSNTDQKNTDLNNTERETTHRNDKNRSDAPPSFSKDVQDFVTKTYPEAYEKAYGCPHPKLTPIQRYRTEQILSDYLGKADEDGISMLEAQAEEFLSTTKTDGSIRAFAVPETLDILLDRVK